MAVRRGPNTPPVMYMRWTSLMFAHWPVAADALRALIPQGVELDTFDGQAWLGVVPFRMEGVRARWTRALPWVSRFPELNVRTYVTKDGVPGVWFFSLDAANPLAVCTARFAFHLPYYDARMRINEEAAQEHAGWVQYKSCRTHQGAEAAEFKARYRPVGDVYFSKEGSLEYFLSERYCFYTQDRQGRWLQGMIDHPPWPLQKAEAEIELNTMADPLGLPLADPPTLLHYSHSIDVTGWLVQVLG